MKRLILSLALICSATALRAEKAAEPAAPAKSYPLDTCIVSGEKLDDKAKVVVAEGQEFKTCCGKCAKKVQADPATYAKKLADAQKK